MKILQVNKFLYPKGGAEIVCLGLGEMLAEAGHEVVWFGMDDERNIHSADRDTFPPGIDYHASRSVLDKVPEALRTVYGLRARRGMEQILDRHQPDLVHLHNIYHQLTPSILSPIARRGIPIMLTLHDYKLICPVYTMLHEGEVCTECLARGPEPILEKRCKEGRAADSFLLWAEDRLHRFLKSYDRVDLFTAPSAFLRDLLQRGRLQGKRVEHLPNFLPLAQDVVARPWQPSSRGQQAELLWIGRMSHEKGLLTLLSALSEVRASVRLTLVGDGPYEGKLRRHAESLGLGEKLRWYGRADRGDIPNLVLASDGTVIPSEWYENAPLSLLESLALGRPALGSRIGGIPEMLQDGVNGWLFEPGDRESLTSAIEAWALDPDQRNERGQAAYKLARERYGREAILERTLAAYRSLIS